MFLVYISESCIIKIKFRMIQYIRLNNFQEYCNLYSKESHDNVDSHYV